MKLDTNTLLLLAGAAAVAYYLYSGGSSAKATPYSIYPSLARSSAQKASTASTAAPTSLFAATQAQARAAILSQCSGSYPGCSMLLADTQLGF